MCKNFLIIFTSLLFLSSIQAQTENTTLLKELLDLPSPPPASAAIKNQKENRPRSPEFYSGQNIPKDEAPIGDLIDYWKRQNYLRQNSPKPEISDQSLVRLISEIKRKPDILTDYLNIIPAKEEYARPIKEIFDEDTALKKQDEHWHKEVKEWLKYNSKFFLEELILSARKAEDTRDKIFNYVKKERELKALAEVDWKAAEPILKTLENNQANPLTSIFAKGLLFNRAIEKEYDDRIKKYRLELTKLLENKGTKPELRDAAFESLSLNQNWEGFEEWYLTLLEDETLLKLNLTENTIAHPLKSVVLQNPDKWIPIMSKLISHKNFSVHSHAVSNLVQFQNNSAREDALKPLLPWISNPKWASEEISDERGRLIQSMSELDLPESIPSLIWTVENDEYYADDAVKALVKYKAFQAVPAIKNRLNKISDEDGRRDFIIGLLELKGLTPIEQMSALESYIKEISTPTGYERIEKREDWEEKNPLPLKISIGNFLARLKEPNVELVNLALEKEKIFKKENPKWAEILSNIMQNWQGRAAYLAMLNKISDNTATAPIIVSALAKRKEIREKALPDVYAMTGNNSLAEGISACLTENQSDLLNALGKNDPQTSIAVLACSRLIRAKLPVEEVGNLLESNDNLLALAAERYLISEDSPKARELVLSKYPGKARVLGARHSFNPAGKRRNELNVSLIYLFRSIRSQYELSPDYGYGDLIGSTQKLEKTEEKFRKEILENNKLKEIYAFGNHRIRVFENKIIYRWHLDEARYREREVTSEEFNKFQNQVIEKDVFNMAPVRGPCHYNCATGEFLILNKNGGRRVFMFAGFYRFAPFVNLFTALQKDDAKLNYHLSEKVKGLEVLLADKNHGAKAIWKNGKDFRVLIEDKNKKKEIADEVTRLNKLDRENEDLEYEEKEKRIFQSRAERAFDHFEWRKFENGKITNPISEPAHIPYLKDKLSFPAIKGLHKNESPWQSQVGNFEIRSGEYGKGGLWKINQSEQFQFLEGLYGDVIITPDKKWAVVSATDNESWAGTDYAARINLINNKKYKINLPEADFFDVISFVSAHNKVLTRRSRDTYYEKIDKDNPSPKTPEYYLLDANTGKTTLVKGEFRPLIQQTFRPLQPTGQKDEFWAAIPNKDLTKIGKYNARTFSFESVLKIPDIKLESMNIWIDEADAKVYFVYEGDLLSLPLKKREETKK